MSLVTKWLPIFFGCHQRADRSFHYKGKKFPICARCTGELVGMIVGLFSYYFYQVPIWLAVLLMIPLVVDGVIQLLTSYESNNPLRFITGVLFGYALISLIIIPMIYAINRGYDLGRSLRGKYF